MKRLGVLACLDGNLDEAVDYLRQAAEVREGFWQVLVGNVVVRFRLS